MRVCWAPSPSRCRLPPPSNLRQRRRQQRQRIQPPLLQVWCSRVTTCCLIRRQSFHSTESDIDRVNNSNDINHDQTATTTTCNEPIPTCPLPYITDRQQSKAASSTTTTTTTQDAVRAAAIKSLLAAIAEATVTVPHLCLLLLQFGMNVASTTSYRRHRIEHCRRRRQPKRPSTKPPVRILSRLRCCDVFFFFFFVCLFVCLIETKKCRTQ
jgi:hypothetical protein